MFGINKSITDRKIFGVIGGIAKRFNIDSNKLRLIILVLSLILFKEILICYLGLAIILPTEKVSSPRAAGRSRTIRDAKKVK